MYPSNGEIAVRPVAFQVTSQHKPGQVYNVHLATCDCRDFQFRRGTGDSPFCKHIIAAYVQAGWQLPA